MQYYINMLIRYCIKYDISKECIHLKGHGLIGWFVYRHFWYVLNNEQVFPFFRRGLAPAQRAAGGCSPLKVTPGRGLAARRIFFTKVVKINDFKVEIIVFM